jgi:hypothetical protein
MTTVTLGIWDASGGSGPGIEIFAQSGDGLHTISNFYLAGNWGGVVSWSANPVTNVYELAVNDVFNTIPDTARFYATFQGVTTPFPQLTIPMLFQASTIQNGATFVDEAFICPASSPLFCDDYITGGGATIGGQSWLSPGTTQPTLSAIAPGSPYDLTLVIHIASSLCTNVDWGCGDFVDFGSAVVVDPTADGPHPVPGPIAGEGLSAALAAVVFSTLLYKKWKTS